MLFSKYKQRLMLLAFFVAVAAELDKTDWLIG
jgi:hypothetical protein